MIKLFHTPGATKLICIDNIPDGAIALVEKFETEFHKRPSFSNDETWDIPTDMSFKKARQLQQGLKVAGFESEFVDLYQSRAIARQTDSAIANPE